MKRLLLTLAAIAAMAGPMTLAGEALAQDRGRDHYSDRNGRGDRDGYRGDRNDGRRNDNGRYDRGRYNDGRDNDRRGRDNRWDDGRHNGYYYNNRWSYGAPPAAYYGRPGFRPGYTSWRRGGYLPPYYRSNSYVIHDYGYYRLRPPPRGYYWYRTGNDYVLAAIATGLIFDIIDN